MARILLKSVGDPVQAMWTAHAQRMCRRAKYKAAERRRAFNLTPESVYNMMQCQGFRCAVSGAPFSPLRRKHDPWAPSLDQIRPGGGYTTGNTRVVVVIVNFAMNKWGERALADLVRWMNGTPHVAPQP